MRNKNKIFALLCVFVTSLQCNLYDCLAVDPLRVQLLALHEPELNADWGTEGSVPVLRYTPARFQSTDNESVLVALEACQRARLRGFVVPKEWIAVCRERLAQGEKFPRLRGELASLLLSTNDPQDAELLWKTAQGDRSLSLAVESRLIEWKSALALEAWRKRLTDIACTKDQLLVAVEGVAKLGGNDDVPALEELLRNRKQPLSVRYVAAQGISRIDAAKALALLEEVVAGKIVGDLPNSDQAEAKGPVWDFWLACAYLIGSSESEKTKELLIETLKKGSNVARTVAVRQLAKMSAGEFKNQLELVRQDSEINVRLEVLKFLTQNVDDEAIVTLGEYLGDEQPRVRESARDELLKLADNESYRPLIVREVARQLKSEKWWQVEQALIATASLKMEDEETQLLALLKHPQPEVYVTAAWALRILLNSPEGVAEVVELVKSETDLNFKGPILEDSRYHRLAHLIEALSIRKVSEAKATIARYVPKNQSIGLVSRMSGLWGMGQYLKEKPEERFSDAYVVVIYDKMGPGSEFGIMRYCALIALGNMADPNTKEKIVELDEEGTTPLALAKKWTLEQIEKREKLRAAGDE